jgi:hypothetical protein
MNYLKPETVESLKLKQVQYEVTAWKRALVFMMEENIHLKSRLSEILKNKLHKQFLTEIEAYQNNFVQLDDLIGLLRNDIAGFEKLLAGASLNEEGNMDELEAKLFTIRNNIGLAKTQFELLRNEFNDFLLKDL